MRRPALAVALCVLVTLAGCSFAGTPAAGPDGLTAENAPPGVSAGSGELTDPAALLDAHTAALRESGFVLDVRSNATVSRDGEARRVKRRQVVRAEPGMTHYNTTVLNPGSRFDVWGNRSVEAARVRAGDTTRYRTRGARSAEQLSGRTLLSRYLTADGWSVTEVERQDGETLVTLRSSTLPGADGVVPSGASDVRNYGAVMVVDSDGRVRFFEAKAEYTIEGTDGSVTVRQQAVSLSGPEIPRPDWLAAAFDSS